MSDIFRTKKYPRIPVPLEYIGAEILGITAQEFMNMDYEPREPLIGNRYDHIMWLARKVVKAEIQLKRNIKKAKQEIGGGVSD